MAFEHRNGYACSEVEDALDDAMRSMSAYYQALEGVRRLLGLALGVTDLNTALGLIEDAEATVKETIGPTGAGWRDLRPTA